LSNTSAITYLSHPTVSASPMLKRIPKAVRPACAALLVDVLEAVVVEPKNTFNWINMLASDHNVLSKLKRGGNKRSLV